MPIRFQTKIEGLDDAIGRVAGIDRHMEERVTVNFQVLGVKVVRWMRDAVEPVRYRGSLERSISVGINPAQMQMSVGPTAPHAAFVYYGTRPHWAPIAPLKEWARWKLGSEDAAYAVQKSIARYGTSQYLLKSGAPGVWRSPYGVGLDFLSVVMDRGDFQNAVEATAARIGMDLVAGTTGETTG